MKCKEIIVAGSQTGSARKFIFGLDIFPRGSMGGTESQKHVMAQPKTMLTGWFIPESGFELHGIRAIRGKSIYKARRKHSRVDVMRKFPELEHSLHSGFVVDLNLNLGINEITFQYKDENRQWNNFSQCKLFLPPWWPVLLLINKYRRKPSTYEIWLSKHRQELEKAGRQIIDSADALESLPKISLLVPIFDPPVKWLRRMISSVRNQTYANWQLCLADDCSTNPAVRRVLLAAAASDSRIKVHFREQNGHICKASNSALKLCTGEFTALLDHDDEIVPEALVTVVKAIIEHPEIDLWFSDEDKISETGKSSDPFFKPGWSPDLLYQQNCFSHFGIFRTSLIKKIGGFCCGTEGSQDWDLVLRAIEATGVDKVMHIPAMLYHWRTIPNSTAAGMEAKPYTITAGRKAVEAHLARTQPEAKLIDLDKPGQWKIEWPQPVPAPKVSIIIPTRNHGAMLKACLDSLVLKTSYSAFEVVIVDHLSDEDATLRFLEECKMQPERYKIVRAEGEFNWSRLSNLGAEFATGDIFVFLNNDIEVIEPNWLGELVSMVCRKDVGAAGACLLYPNDCIQHAGVVIGMSGIAGHVFRYGRPNFPSAGGNPGFVRDVSAVTGACLAVQRETFHTASGFDAEDLPISYSDIDFCLRLRKMGLRIIYTPFARLIHHESVSRGACERTSKRKNDASREARFFSKRWLSDGFLDPYFNPNLSLNSEIPDLPDV